MIQRVRFVKKFRCVGEGDRVAFRSGVNLLVGDQGSGKSSPIEAIRRYSNQPAVLTDPSSIEVATGGKVEVFFFDF